jgi:hypothetical protein
MLPPADIKKALRAAGFEVYRTQRNVVHVAERVRENLIMDSGIRIVGAGVVVFYARAQRGDFPSEADDELVARARTLGEPALGCGYREVRSFMTELTDPGQPGRVLDQWHEVQFAKQVTTIAAAIDEVRFAYDLDKVAGR